MERYKVLTFFFDGVPPIEKAELEPGPVDLASRWFVQRVTKSDWYMHKPLNNCVTCHGERKQRSFSPQTLLTSPVPELCYNCHTNYAVSSSFVHGPVAVGQCLFCHNPHKSKFKHLLKEPEPKLCYLCHDSSAIESVPAHLTKLSSGCTNCHSAHAGSTKYLLKPASFQSREELNGVNSIDKVVQRHIQAEKKQYEKQGFELTEKTNTTGLERKRLFQALWTVNKLIEQGELMKAKIYLEEIKENNAFTPKEQEKIEQVLRLMDIQLTGSKTHQENIKQGESVTEQGSEQSTIEPKETDNQQDEKKREIAELYYRSLAFYRTGQLEKAREGFVKVLQSGLVPEPMVKTIGGYLVHIDNTLAKRAKSPSPEQ
ncbi:MAG: cytochrome c3 family protein [Sedimentisphaerales bacterium]